MFIVKQSSVTDVTVASPHNELLGRQTNNFIHCYFIALQSLKENEVYETEALWGKSEMQLASLQILTMRQKNEKIRDHNASRTPPHLLPILRVVQMPTPQHNFIILIPTKHKFSLAVANLEMFNLYLRWIWMKNIN